VFAWRRWREQPQPVVDSEGEDTPTGVDPHVVEDTPMEADPLGVGDTHMGEDTIAAEVTVAVEVMTADTATGDPMLGSVLVSTSGPLIMQTPSILTTTQITPPTMALRLVQMSLLAEVTMAAVATTAAEVTATGATAVEAEATEEAEAMAVEGIRAEATAAADAPVEATAVEVAPAAAGVVAAKADFPIRLSMAMAALLRAAMVFLSKVYTNLKR